MPGYLYAGMINLELIIDKSALHRSGDNSNRAYNKNVVMRYCLCTLGGGGACHSLRKSPSYGGPIGYFFHLLPGPFLRVGAFCYIFRHGGRDPFHMWTVFCPCIWMPFLGLPPPQQKVLRRPCLCMKFLVEAGELEIFKTNLKIVFCVKDFYLVRIGK